MIFQTTKEHQAMGWTTNSLPKACGRPARWLELDGAVDEGLPSADLSAAGHWEGGFDRNRYVLRGQSPSARRWVRSHLRSRTACR
jgi:hypothetical protein